MSINGVSLDWLQDYITIFLIFILLGVRGLLVSLWFNSFIRSFVLEFSFLEVIWTILPAGILICLGVPSLIILYKGEKSFLRSLSLKIIGHQWFWGYDFRDFKGVEFDRYMASFRDLRKGGFRLLRTDNNVVLPNKRNVRLLITSADVLHSWAIPSIGVKADANPGRINIIYVVTLVCGMYFGQCSEICGANHSFMPICIEVTPFHSFKNWVKRF